MDTCLICDRVIPQGPDFCCGDCEKIWNAYRVILHESEKLDPVFRNLIDYVLFTPDFRMAPGGAKHHHDFRGGLLIHTAEVLMNVKKMGGVSPELIVATVWHDFMKIRDYEFVEDESERGYHIVDAPYKNLVNHVVGSALEFYREASLAGHGQEFIDKVTHIMLAHHGRKEWGSPVEPKTADALILHAADMMSSRSSNL